MILAGEVSMEAFAILDFFFSRPTPCHSERSEESSESSPGASILSNWILYFVQNGKPRVEPAT
jgi:hypothetical protein